MQIVAMGASKGLNPFRIASERVRVNFAAACDFRFASSPDFPSAS
jgi:hypothetical protein